MANVRPIPARIKYVLASFKSPLLIDRGRPYIVDTALGKIAMSDHTHIVCGHCDAVVRAPNDRLDQKPKCPRCRQTLFAGHPIELRTANFDQHVTRNEVPMIVDFWAPWCGPCQAMAPRFTEAAQHFEPHVRFAKVNSDDEPQVSARFGIRGIPTLIAFKNGREVARQSGAMDSGTLTRWIQSALNS
jgi:thioredoxin 2